MHPHTHTQTSTLYNIPTPPPPPPFLHSVTVSLEVHENKAFADMYTKKLSLPNNILVSTSPSNKKCLKIS